jgi:hypothetical protein
MTDQKSVASEIKRLQSQVRTLFKNNDSCTASDLAAAVERDAKVVRARLRSVDYDARMSEQSERKHSRHAIDVETALAIAEHFASAKRVVRT